MRKKREEITLNELKFFFSFVLKIAKILMNHKRNGIASHKLNTEFVKIVKMQEKYFQFLFPIQFAHTQKMIKERVKKKAILTKI